MNDDGSRREGPGSNTDDCVIGSSDRFVFEGDDGSSVRIHDELGSGRQEGGSESGVGSSSGSSVGGEVVALPTRKARQGISRSFVELELSEHIKDLAAFKRAYSQIHSRVLEVRDEGRLMKLVNWSGTSAVMGSLELTIHAIERTVEELKDLLKRLDAGAIFDSDKV